MKLTRGSMTYRSISFSSLVGIESNICCWFRWLNEFRQFFLFYSNEWM